MFALDCKFWWRFRSRSSLWADFMASKYVKGTDHDSFTNSQQGGSRIWRKMLRASQIVEDNSHVLVRDGSSSFWFDNWLGDGPLTNPSFSVPSPTAHISDYFLNGSWQIETLSPFILAAHATDIRSLALCPGIKDKIV